MSDKKDFLSTLIFLVFVIIIAFMSFSKVFSNFENNTGEKTEENSGENINTEPSNEYTGISSPYTDNSSYIDVSDANYTAKQAVSSPYAAYSDPKVSDNIETITSGQTQAKTSAPVTASEAVSTQNVRNTAASSQTARVPDANTLIPDDKTNDENTVEVMTFSSEDITEILEKKLSDMGFPISGVSAEIEKDSSFSVSGKCVKSELKTYISENFKEHASKADIALILMPKELSVYLNFSVSCNAESRLLSVSVNKLVLNEIEIPSGLVESVLNSKISEILNQLICDKSVYFTDIELDDGQIVLYSQSI